ncbi:hypothetical protein GEPA3_3513 [Geobacillus sp. PA-3]|nr:hypothetical protein GEPA3_3513 [Geobacillus sp. PA-3]
MVGADEGGYTVMKRAIWRALSVLPLLFFA